jgi:hypothetical protein
MIPSIISFYASLICPLSPFARSLIIAILILLALVHVRIMYMVEGWLASMGPSPRLALALLIGAHVDAAIVAGVGLLHIAAEATCQVPSRWPIARAALVLAGALSMVSFAWILFGPRIRASAPRP